MYLADTLRYNSAFYSSLATNDYEIYVVSPSFLLGGNASNIVYAPSTLVPADQLQQNIANNDTSNFQLLDILQCIKTYGQVFMQDYRNLVIVSKNSSNDSSPSVFHEETYTFNRYIYLPSQTYMPFDW